MAFAAVVALLWVKDASPEWKGLPLGSSVFVYAIRSGAITSSVVDACITVFMMAVQW